MTAFQPPLHRRRLAIPADRPLIYAIGDVHGCHDALLALEERIRTDAADHAHLRPLILYLGDYVDRGPASNAVIEHLAAERHSDGIERIALCGNHDDTFLKFIFDPQQHRRWLDFGGDATLRSYGLALHDYLDRADGMEVLGKDLQARIPSHHVAFLQNLPVALLSGKRLFVHAGIRPGVPLWRQEDHDMIWIREPFLSEGPGLPVTVIHGHTAGLEPVFGKGRICIDTTCYATGRLTALKVTPEGATLLQAGSGGSVHPRF
ncbi:metallophosphoesterase [Shinella sp. BYT-45]|uniref:metallophosphoesterase n=1 Tax=Shinella sp. BYT-45 TaxID=3377377 RepID=UPI00397FE921